MAAFATPADLAALLQRDVDTATATLLLDLASGSIREYCDWNITTETVTNQLLPIPATLPYAWSKLGLDVAYTTRGYTLDILTLNLTAVALFEDNVALVNGTDYTWQSDGEVLRLTPLWNKPQTSLTVTYTHGYDAIPASVKSVALEMAKRVFINPGGMFQQTTGRVSEQYAVRGTVPGSLALTNEDKDLVAQYRPYVLA